MQAVCQVSNMLSWKKNCFPRWENYFLDKLVAEIFWSKQLHYLLVYWLIFLGKNFLEHIVKSCWHRWPQFSVLIVNLSGCRWSQFSTLTPCSLDHSSAGVVDDQDRSAALFKVRWPCINFPVVVISASGSIKFSCSFRWRIIFRII